MKLNTQKFALACALTAAVLWLACSALVSLLPGLMLSMSGHMVHMQLENMGWHLTVVGFIGGLVAWSVVAGATGALLSAIYNRLL